MINYRMLLIINSTDCNVGYNNNLCDSLSLITIDLSKYRVDYNSNY